MPVFGARIFKEEIVAKLGLKRGALSDRIVRRRDIKAHSPFPLSHKKAMGGQREKVALSKPGRELSP